MRISQECGESNSIGVGFGDRPATSASFPCVVVHCSEHEEGPCWIFIRLGASAAGLRLADLLHDVSRGRVASGLCAGFSYQALGRTEPVPRHAKNRSLLTWIWCMCLDMVGAP